MARLPIRSLAGLFPFVFSLLAFTFSLLAVTSPDWVSRKQYADNTDSISQTSPIYTLYRSPFQICIEDITVDPSNNPDTNSTSSNGDNQGDNPPESLNYTYTSTCLHFAVYGANATSCELPSELGSNLAPQAGDARQCQQIHLAANYHVASAVFLGVAMLVCLAGAGAGFLPPHRRGQAPADAGESSAPRRGRFAVAHIVPSRLSQVVQTVLFPLAAVGAATALLAQFYAVLGLVQSAPNNADFATSQGNREHHDPWVQGRALNTYLSFSWFWAVLAAWAGWTIWGEPKVEVISRREGTSNGAGSKEGKVVRQD